MIRIFWHYNPEVPGYGDRWHIAYIKPPDDQYALLAPRTPFNAVCGTRGLFATSGVGIGAGYIPDTLTGRGHLRTEGLNHGAFLCIRCVLEEGVTILHPSAMNR